MPWNNQNGGGRNGGGRGPWGNGPSHGGSPPDLEELLKRSQERLRQHDHLNLRLSVHKSP